MTDTFSEYIVHVVVFQNVEYMAFLAFEISIGQSAVILVRFPLYVACASSLGAFNIIFSSVYLSVSTMTCYGFCFLVLSIRSLHSSCICMGMSFLRVGTFFLLSYWKSGVCHYPGICLPHLCLRFKDLDFPWCCTVPHATSSSIYVCFSYSLLI